MNGVEPEARSVTVIMSVLNGEAHIVRAVESLLAQTLPPVEVIIVDDGSTDETPARLGELRERFPDVVSVFSQPNRGIGSSLNRAASAATGTYLAVADSDDHYPPSRLATTARLLDATGADMAGGQCVGGWGRHLKLARSRFPGSASGIEERVQLGWDPLPHTTMMVRRSSFERFGGYRRVRRSEDLELMLRWARLGASIVVSPDVLAWYELRREHFSINVQAKWMINTAYARVVAGQDDASVPDFDDWFAHADLGPMHREACRRVFRLVGRVVVGTLRL